MFLHRIYLDLRCKEARRDLADPYELHSTLCRAFTEADKKCPQGEFLWRLESGSDAPAEPCVLVQSRSIPDWSRIGVKGWFREFPEPPIDLEIKLKLNSLTIGQHFRFRLRANPCVTKNGKRLGLLQLIDQEKWIERKGLEQCGFALPKLASFFEDNTQSRVDVMITQQQMLHGQRHSGIEKGIHVFSVLYDGVLKVTDPEKFHSAIENGLGHGKTMGLGMLSVAPAR